MSENVPVAIRNEVNNDTKIGYRVLVSLFVCLNRSNIVLTSINRSKQQPKINGSLSGDNLFWC